MKSIIYRASTGNWYALWQRGEQRGEMKFKSKPTDAEVELVVDAYFLSLVPNIVAKLEAEDGYVS